MSAKESQAIKGVVHRHSSHGQPRCGVYQVPVAVSEDDADVTCRRCFKLPPVGKEEEMVDAAKLTERERLIAGYEEELRSCLDREVELRDLIARLSAAPSRKRDVSKPRRQYPEEQMLRMRAHGSYMYLLKFFEPAERETFRAIYKGNDVQAAILAMKQRLDETEQPPSA
jgi:hypothetical protein